MTIHLSRPDITQQEIDAVCKVLLSPNLSLGPTLREFEEAMAAYIGTRYAVAVNSGTSALFLCLKAMGIGPGTEVITTPFTFIATATSIMMVGAKPIFADIDPETLNLDPTALTDRITERTKAVIPVEVFGNPAGMDRIREAADEHQLLVLEDSCEALGTLLGPRRAGTFGHMSVFGFYPNKQITTGEGGMILTDHQPWAELCVSLRNQGRGPQGTWLGHERLGYNFRLSDINCALGIAQLSRIEQCVAKRARVARWYQERLDQDERLVVPVAPQDSRMSWFVFVVRLSEAFTQADRDHLIKDLAVHGIQTNNYFPPVHLQPVMVRQYGFRPGLFPIAEAVSQRTLALPFYNNLQEDQVDTVCRQLREALDRLPSRQQACVRP